MNKKGHICAADGGYSPTRAVVIDAHNSIRWPGTLVHGGSCRHAAVFMIVWVATACSVGVRPAFCPETCYFLVIEHALEAIGSKAKKAASKAPKSNDDNIRNMTSSHGRLCTSYTNLGPNSANSCGEPAASRLKERQLAHSQHCKRAKPFAGRQPQWPAAVLQIAFRPSISVCEYLRNGRGNLPLRRDRRHSRKDLLLIHKNDRSDAAQ